MGNNVGVNPLYQTSLTLTFALQLASCVTSENFPELSNLPFSHQGSEGNSAVPLGFVRGLNGIMDRKNRGLPHKGRRSRVSYYCQSHKGDKKDIKIIRQNPCNSLWKIKCVNRSLQHFMVHGQ